MPSYYIDTFGCQMNVADSNMLAELLESRGFVPGNDSITADLIVVNTCSVRENAEKRAQSRIAEYINQRTKSGRRQTVWVVGCMAQRMGESLKDTLPGVNRVIGAEKLEFIGHDLDEYLADAFDTAKLSAANSYGISAFLPVMRGCDNYCAYCIVPYVRGREHSLLALELVDHAKRMVEGGVKEITLLGQNVNSYNDGSSDFSDLLERLHAIEGLARIRFTTSHPKDLSDKLIDTVAALPKVCSHIHLPVQSGSTNVLKAMNRKYTREDYLDRVVAIRARIPDVDLTTDVMVGFPGETEQDYLDTLSLFEQVRYTNAFMFAYSIREGTSAARMDKQVPDAVKKARLEKLIALQTKITKERFAGMVGSQIQVLFTRRQEKRDRAWMGQDYGCKRVLLDCSKDLTGMILDVRVTRSSGMTLLGERIDT